MDSGAQLERTRLAWRRTVLAAAVVTLLAARLVMMNASGPFAPAGLAIIMLAWLGLAGLARRRIRRLSRPAGYTLPAMVLLVLVYCVLAAVILVLSSDD